MKLYGVNMLNYTLPFYRGHLLMMVDAADELAFGTTVKIPEAFADQKFSGKFQVRIPPEQHRALALEAAEQHVSLNRLVSSRLKVA